MDRARKDRRYKDEGDAPAIVSEKRLTFFLKETVNRELKLQAGLLQIANATAEADDDPLPESPSAVVREAVDFWLDQFRPVKERMRSDAEWEERVRRVKAAVAR